MYRKALEIVQALGHQEGMANAYSNLGVVFWIRGDLRPTVGHVPKKCS